MPAVGQQDDGRGSVQSDTDRACMLRVRAEPGSFFIVFAGIRNGMYKGESTKMQESDFLFSFTEAEFHEYTYPQRRHTQQGCTVF